MPQAGSEDRDSAKENIMFTGIITDVGTIRSVVQRGDLRIEIATGYDVTTVDMGASIACDGVCLTVVEKTSDSF